MKLSNKPLAMAYVPWQPFENVMDAECGMKQGTIFEDLIFPFVGSQAACQAHPMPNKPNSNSCGRYNTQQPFNQNNSYGRRCGY